MNIFTIFLTKLRQNILQNAPNCTILKFFSGGPCPRTPSKRHYSKNNFNAPPPLPRNKSLDTPLHRSDGSLFI